MTPDIKELEKKVDKVLNYLHNDEGTGTKGLVADFAEHKKLVNEFMTKYANEQDLKKAKIGAWGSLGGAIVAGIALFFKWLLTDSNT